MEIFAELHRLLLNATFTCTTQRLWRCDIL